MSVPLLIALESTPLLAPIVLSMAPIVIPSLEAISCILDKILPIIENYPKIITIFAACLRCKQRAKYTKKACD